MKKILKNFVILPVLVLMMFSALILNACGQTEDKRDLIVSETVKTDTEDVITFIQENIYNNSTTFGNQKDYTVQEIKDKGGDFANFTYYVELGTLKNFGNVASINLNGTVYKSDNNVFKMSVGNSNFIVDNAYYVNNDNKLFVAAPVIAFESTVNSKVTINDKEFELNFQPATETLQVTSVNFQSGATGTVARVEGTNQYNATFGEFNKWIEFHYENAQSTDVFLTKKVLDGKLLSYGFTTIDVVGSGDDTDYVLAYYACPYYNTYTEEQYNAVKANYDGKACDYSIYCVGKGSAKLKINYIIPEYQA